MVSLVLVYWQEVFCTLIKDFSLMQAQVEDLSCKLDELDRMLEDIRCRMMEHSAYQIKIVDKEGGDDDRASTSVG